MAGPPHALHCRPLVLDRAGTTLAERGISHLLYRYAVADLLRAALGIKTEPIKVFLFGTVWQIKVKRS